MFNFAQLINLLLAAATTYFLTGYLKGKTGNRLLDGWKTVLAACVFGAVFILLFGWLGDFVGWHSGLNWLPGGLATYALCSFFFEGRKAAKDKADKGKQDKEKPSEHGKPA